MDHPPPRTTRPPRRKPAQPGNSAPHQWRRTLGPPPRTPCRGSREYGLGGAANPESALRSCTLWPRPSRTCSSGDSVLRGGKACSLPPAPKHEEKTRSSEDPLLEQRCGSWGALQLGRVAVGPYQHVCMWFWNPLQLRGVPPIF